MSDRPETIEDIIREMRDLGALDEQCGDMIPRSLQALGLRTYAERLEAARKRDTGNAAALRRALEDTEELLEHFAKPGTILHSAFFLHMLDNRAALAAPPRNCDRFKAADEARKAFWDTHETIWDAFKNRGGTELFYEVLDWLFAPAEGGEK